jgi:hypothetical protein
MQLSACHASANYLVEEQQLRAVFCADEPRKNVRFERALYIVSVPVLVLVLVLSLVAADMLGLPGFAYLLELFVSLCS